jgi:hypothetical protein
MGAFAIVEVEVAIQVLLQLRDRLIQRGSERGCEELFLDGAMEAFSETVGLR